MRLAPPIVKKTPETLALERIEVLLTELLSVSKKQLVSIREASGQPPKKRV